MSYVAAFLGLPLWLQLQLTGLLFLAGLVLLCLGLARLGHATLSERVIVICMVLIVLTQCNAWWAIK